MSIITGTIAKLSAPVHFGRSSDVIWMSGVPAEFKRRWAQAAMVGMSGALCSSDRVQSARVARQGGNDGSHHAPER
jgi:hypothetical protein